MILTMWSAICTMSLQRYHQTITIASLNVLMESSGTCFHWKKNPLCLWDPRLTKKTLIKEKISVIGDSFRSIHGCSQMLDCYVHREFLSISYHQNQCLYRTYLQHQFGASPIIEGLLLTGLIQKCRRSHILQNVVEFSLSFLTFFQTVTYVCVLTLADFLGGLKPS